MPLLLSKPISPYSAYSVWNIQETNEVLKGLVNEKTPEDLNPTRLAEWIVGRILIKNLASQFGLKYREITPDESGKPFLAGTEAQISISHSFPMAAAMINLNKTCGIDLERPRQKLIDTQSKFLHESEQEFQNNLDALCKIWCGKEVLYKIYGRRKISLKDEMKIEFIDDQSMRGIITKEQFEGHHRMRVEKLKEYYLAYSL
jgi:4'-phosphopantetheinyl transferase